MIGTPLTRPVSAALQRELIAPEPPRSGEPSEYMKSIVHATRRLHMALADALPRDELQVRAQCACTGNPAIGSHAWRIVT